MTRAEAAKLKEKLEKMYPMGTRVVLEYMDDTYAPPKGSHGTVMFIDDSPQIHVNWDNGGSLALIYGHDKFRKCSN